MIGLQDLILNTASHHKVHHGANRYCLDKNYAGVLIIWDRMFGTFQEEKQDIEVVYGLVDQPQFWNPLKHQVGLVSVSNLNLNLKSEGVLLWKSLGESHDYEQLV